MVGTKARVLESHDVAAELTRQIHHVVCVFSEIAIARMEEEQDAFLPSKLGRPT